jgi:hypothetical protein
VAKVKGFKLGKSAEKVTIQFGEGHALHGIEVVVERRVPIGVVLGASAGDIARAIEPLISRIVSWNLLDDDDNPVPVSRAAFDAQFDIEQATELVGGWLTTVAGTAAPLGQPSKNGSS